jgi:hypothetical protein
MLWERPGERVQAMVFLLDCGMQIINLDDGDLDFE